MESRPREDIAECREIRNPDKKWDDNDHTYSNQGGSGTCARHVCSKAITFDILKETDGEVKLATRDVFAAITAATNFGPTGNSGLDFDDKSF